MSCLFFKKISNWLEENETTSAIEVYQYVSQVATYTLPLQLGYK